MKTCSEIDGRGVVCSLGQITTALFEVGGAVSSEHVVCHTNKIQLAGALLRCTYSQYRHIAPSCALYCIPRIEFWHAKVCEDFSVVACPRNTRVLLREAPCPVSN